MKQAGAELCQAQAELASELIYASLAFDTQSKVTSNHYSMFNLNNLRLSFICKHI
jgi:hypothetical protein